ncbi:MAG: hypothetical protein KJ697_01485 [Nanoarchaeota archaeon]|nr:hypothetical protein [Nanoarchaeota archaeon]MBU4124190.1 hypothetical protein [Nanoarchaeota archaeon]
MEYEIILDERTRNFYKKLIDNDYSSTYINLNNVKASQIAERADCSVKTARKYLKKTRGITTITQRIFWPKKKKITAHWYSLVYMINIKQILQKQ